MGAPSDEGLQLPAAGVHIPYTIVNQLPRSELNAANQWVDLWEITYKGPSGTVGKVKVPVEQYNPAEVDRIIQAELEKVEGVAALGPQPHPENAA